MIHIKAETGRLSYEYDESAWQTLSEVFNKIYQTMGSDNLNGHDILINSALLTAEQEDMWMGRIDRIVDDGETIYISFVERHSLIKKT